MEASWGRTGEDVGRGEEEERERGEARTVKFRRVQSKNERFRGMKLFTVRRHGQTGL